MSVSAPDAVDRRDDNLKIVRVIRTINVVALLATACLLFGVAVAPTTSDVGLVFLAWLTVFGSGAVWLDHKLLDAALAVRGDIRVLELFSRRGRRGLREDPDAYFSAEDHARFRKWYRTVVVFVGAAVVVLTALTAATTADDVRELWAVMVQPEGQWWEAR